VLLEEVEDGLEDVGLDDPELAVPVKVLEVVPPAGRLPQLPHAQASAVVDGQALVKDPAQDPVLLLLPMFRAPVVDQLDRRPKEAGRQLLQRHPKQRRHLPRQQSPGQLVDQVIGPLDRQQPADRLLHIERASLDGEVQELGEPDLTSPRVDPDALEMAGRPGRLVQHLVDDPRWHPGNRRLVRSRQEPAVALHRVAVHEQPVLDHQVRDPLLGRQRRIGQGLEPAPDVPVQLGQAERPGLSDLAIGSLGALRQVDGEPPGLALVPGPEERGEAAVDGDVAVPLILLEAQEAVTDPRVVVGDEREVAEPEGVRSQGVEQHPPRGEVMPAQHRPCHRQRQDDEAAREGRGQPGAETGRPHDNHRHASDIGSEQAHHHRQQQGGERQDRDDHDRRHRRQVEGIALVPGRPLLSGDAVDEPDPQPTERRHDGDDRGDEQVQGRQKDQHQVAPFAPAPAVESVDDHGDQVQAEGRGDGAVVLLEHLTDHPVAEGAVDLGADAEIARRVALVGIRRRGGRCGLPGLWGGQPVAHVGWRGRHLSPPRRSYRI
jgi:hypothetical protein